MEKLVAAAIEFKLAHSGDTVVMTGKRHADVFLNMHLHEIEYQKPVIQGF